MARVSGNSMSRDATGAYRVGSGAFRGYVRGVFADHTERLRMVREKRTRWLFRRGQRLLAQGRKGQASTR